MNVFTLTLWCGRQYAKRSVCVKIVTEVIRKHSHVDELSDDLPCAPTIIK